MADSFHHEVKITDPATGDTWIASQLVGFGIAGMGESLHSHVRFTNQRTGAVLEGRADGITAASEEELRASLEDAQRRDAFARQHGL